MGFATAARDDSLSARWADVGPGSALELRTGAAPALPTASGTLLGTVTLADTPAAAAAAIVIHGAVSVPITVDGTIGHARITKTDGTTGHVTWEPAELVGEAVTSGQTVDATELSQLDPDFL